MNHMPDYKAMYFALAAQVADAVELLTAAQRAGEETYIDAQDEQSDKQTE